MLSLLNLTTSLALLAIHGVASYYDVKQREIPDRVWLAVPLLAAVTLYYVVVHASQLLRLLYLIDVGIAAVLSLVMLLGRLAGGADVKSLVSIALCVLPPLRGDALCQVLSLPVVSVMLNSLLGVLGYSTYILWRNRKVFRICADRYELRWYERALLQAAVLCIPVREVLRQPHRYAPILSRRRLALTFRVEEEDYVNTLRQLLSMGVLHEDEYVLATYYMPYIVCLTLGLALHIALGGSIVELALHLV